MKSAWSSAVYAIDSDWGWYYFGCCICNKKVVKVGTLVKTLHGKEITTHIWWCEVCKENVSNVSQGETKLMLLDLIAKGMIIESAMKLLNGSFDELEDPTDLPDAILAVVGKTFTFGISVEKEHVLYGSEIYKVGKIFKDRMVALTDSVKLENSQTDGVLTLTSGEESSVRLTESQEHTDGMFTPSTKRKEAWNDPPADLTSHTKKLCSKAIKVEKMNDLEAEANKNT
uniref:Replication factor A C-terminal domain-containing protein n=1 Tax=Brassica oleracea var. oleracea TaxID=109376 RepID=A0A0D2ZQK9_BRAOL